MKKVIVLTAALLMTASLLAGCGGFAIVKNGYGENTADIPPKGDTSEESSQISHESTGTSDGEAYEEYEEILEDYGKIVDFRLSPSFKDDMDNGKYPDLDSELEDYMSDEDINGGRETELQYRWSCMLADMTAGMENPSRDSFGYIFKDLDGDGTPELLWVSSDYNTVFAVFAVYDGDAELIDAYWPRYSGVVTDGGELYTLGSSGADTFEYAVSRLDKDKENPLKTVKRFGCQSGQYYADIDGVTVSISKEDFQKLLSENPFEFGQSWKDNKMYLVK